MHRCCMMMLFYKDIREKIVWDVHIAEVNVLNLVLHGENRLRLETWV